MKTYKYFILFLLSAFLLNACNDFLSEKPSKSTSLVPTTADQLENLLNNYTNFYQEGNRTIIYSSDDYGLLKDMYDAKS
jgi:hypothetical protein